MIPMDDLREKLRIDIDMITKHRQKPNNFTDLSLSSRSNGSTGSTSSTSSFSLIDTPCISKSAPCLFSSINSNSPNATLNTCPLSASPLAFSSSYRDKFIKISPKRNESKIINISETGIETSIVVKRNDSKKISNENVNTSCPSCPKTLELTNSNKLKLTDTKSKTLGKTKSYAALPAYQVNAKDHVSNDKIDANSSIKLVIEYIMETKLKIQPISIENYVKIFKDNLILNLGILYLQNPDSINKLMLPLALENEIKNLITEKKNSLAISSYTEVTVEMKSNLCLLLNNLIKNNYYRNTLFEKFYDEWLNEDEYGKKLVANKHMFAKSKKLFGTISLIIDFLHMGNEIIEKIENMITTHLILKIDDSSIYSKTLVQTVCQVLDGRMDDIMEKVFLLSMNELDNIIKKHYEIIKRGKKYYVYYRKNKKWNKCYCNITHEELIINNYPTNEQYSRMNLFDMAKVELVEDGDIRITKQTEYCIKLLLKDGSESYICTDSKEYCHYIYSDLQVRLRAIDCLEG